MTMETLQQQAAVLFAQGQLEAALALLDQLGEPRAQPAHWHYNRALVLSGLQRHAEALAAFSRAASLGFPLDEVLCQEGILWQARGDWKQALERYTQALAVQPQHALSLFNRGALLLQHRHFDAACTDLDAAAGADGGDLPGLHGGRWLARRHLAQWGADTDALAGELQQGLQQGQPLGEPFTVLAAFDAPELQRRAAQAWLQRPLARHAERSAVAVAAGRKLRIGYFSSDFHDHATLHLLAGVLEAHDR